MHNVDGRLVVTDHSTADLGGATSPGRNAFCFNGQTTPLPRSTCAIRRPESIDGDQQSVGTLRAWLGLRHRCRELRRHLDEPGAVIVRPAQAPLSDRPSNRCDPARHSPNRELVRIYGRGFDAIPWQRSGRRLRRKHSVAQRLPTRVGNCVVIGGEPAEVVAVTPTMIVARAPFPAASGPSPS